MFEQYAVIFDMDGVIIDSGPIHYESWKKLANEIGVSFSENYFKKTFGKQGIPTLKKIINKKVSDKQLHEWVELKEVYYRQMIKNNITAILGVIPLIKELKENFFKLAVATSGPPKNTDLLLTTLKIKHFFDQIVTAIDIKKGKPAPDVFLMVSKNLNISPQNCLVIEDAPVGIKAAKKAEMKCIALATTHEKSKLAKADLIIDSFSEINLNDIIELLKS